MQPGWEIVVSKDRTALQEAGLFGYTKSQESNMTIVTKNPDPIVMFAAYMQRDMFTEPQTPSELADMYQLASGIEKFAEDVETGPIMDDYDDDVASAITELLLGLSIYLKKHAIMQEMELDDRIDANEQWHREEAANEAMLTKEYYKSR